MKKKKLLLFDTNSIIHRAYHALPPLKDKSGKPGGAIYGSLLAFFSILEKTDPDYVAVAFDSPGKTFRHEKYKEYKANRPKAPEDLVYQLQKTKEVFSEMGACVLAKEGIEADDIVGVVAKHVPEYVEVVIVSGDKDILQLVDEKTKVYTLRRGVKDSVLYDKDRVKEDYEGLGPEKIADIKALQGDPSDNIPGVSGIGEKTAVKLIKEYGSVENLYKKIKKEDSSLISSKIKEKLIKEEEKAILSKALAMIKKEKVFDFNIEDFFFNKKSEAVLKAIDDVGFTSIAKRLNPSFKKEEKQNLKLNL